jgi:hypothetical protein
MLINIKEYMRPKARQAVFFMGPYGVPLAKLWWPIRSLQRSGYSVIAYEYPTAIFRTGDPGKLPTAIDETRRHVKATVARLKKQGYTDCGFMGNSLGALIVYNCLKAVPELEWGILNGGGDVAEAAWNFATERQCFEAKGYTLETLRKAWLPVQYPDLGDLRGKNFILISSHGDKLTTYANALKTRDHILNAGPDAEIIMHRRMGHVGTVARNLLRAHKLVRKVHTKSGL